jgi:Zn-dependent protease
MFFGDDTLIERVLFWIPLVLSLSIHEWAHAWAAWRLGDDTAMRMGRLTLNPLAHIDPIGTVLLPLLGVPFGWAKPVPFNPLGFRRGITMRKGAMLVAVAGPLSNLVVAAACIVAVALLARFAPQWINADNRAVWMLYVLILLNVILATFNMLPIPPLDGSRVADALMPRRLRPAWGDFCRLGPIALAAVILLPMLAGISLFEWPVRAASFLLRQLVVLMGG